MEYEYLRELREITEWKDGCIYRTKSLGELWTRESDTGKVLEDNKMLCSLSTKRMKELNYQTMRQVK